MLHIKLYNGKELKQGLRLLKKYGKKGFKEHKDRTMPVMLLKRAKHEKTRIKPTRIGPRICDGGECSRHVGFVLEH